MEVQDIALEFGEYVEEQNERKDLPVGEYAVAIPANSRTASTSHRQLFQGLQTRHDTIEESSKRGAKVLWILSFFRSMSLCTFLVAFFATIYEATTTHFNGLSDAQRSNMGPTALQDFQEFATWKLTVSKLVWGLVGISLLGMLAGYFMRKKWEQDEFEDRGSRTHSRCWSLFAGIRLAIVLITITCLCTIYESTGSSFFLLSVILVHIADALLVLPFLAEAVCNSVEEQEGAEQEGRVARDQDTYSTSGKEDTTMQGTLSEMKTESPREALQRSFGMVAVEEVAKYVSPSDFALWWNHTSTSSEYSLKRKLATEEDTMQILSQHLEKSGFFVIASGTVEGEIKLFAVGLASALSSRQTWGHFCLLEAKSADKSDLHLKVRAQLQQMSHLFEAQMKIKELQRFL